MVLERYWLLIQRLTFKLFLTFWSALPRWLSPFQVEGCQISVEFKGCPTPQNLSTGLASARDLFPVLRRKLLHFGTWVNFAINQGMIRSGTFCLHSLLLKFFTSLLSFFCLKQSCSRKIATSVSLSLNNLAFWKPKYCSVFFFFEDDCRRFLWEY